MGKMSTKILPETKMSIMIYLFKDSRNEIISLLWLPSNILYLHLCCEIISEWPKIYVCKKGKTFYYTIHLYIPFPKAKMKINGTGDVLKEVHAMLDESPTMTWKI